ncbi:hypothetical protein [Polynucleobacter sp. MWH-Braz-FAM2G]|uniref:hypothetical protein n=1 Tax=Polynucleobacter sp. MWH-Braz-FAM2G TaxID=1855883 RepID=UPI001BFD4C88|nr:hypothetical protein [Polynucleobacter sp. MWH-Braz-FAM2G]QWD91652.1 hypothetical protein FD973_04805 [Polynucleobacter sp. MWH-Braz-FAM2G]
MTQEVKNFSSGVLTNGGAFQRVQDREAKKEQDRLRKEAEDKSAAELHAKRIKAREDRALELAEQAKARQAQEEEKQRKAAEKQAQDEVARLRVAAEKEAARLERRQDLERRLQEKANAQKQEDQKSNSQTGALLDDLQIIPTVQEANGETTDEVEEQVFEPVKGEVIVPAEVPLSAVKPDSESVIEPVIARDISELLPPPAVLTVEAEPAVPIQVESGKDLIERVLSSTEQGRQEGDEEATQPNRSENRYQKMANTNRVLSKENEVLKSKVEDLLDKLHGYEIENELVDSVMSSVDRAKKEVQKSAAQERYLNPNPFSIVNDAKQEMLKYLSTRSGEIDHADKSALFVRYIQDPFYMSMFVQNNQVSQWWPMIDAIYNSIDLPPADWSKIKVTPYKPRSEHQTQPQPIRARTATLGAPVANSEQPMDRIAQHLGNMGI